MGVRGGGWEGGQLGSPGSSSEGSASPDFTSEVGPIGHHPENISQMRRRLLGAKQGTISERTGNFPTVSRPADLPTSPGSFAETSSRIASLASGLLLPRTTSDGGGVSPTGNTLQQPGALCAGNTVPMSSQAAGAQACPQGQAPLSRRRSLEPPVTPGSASSRRPPQSSIFSRSPQRPGPAEPGCEGAELAQKQPSQRPSQTQPPPSPGGGLCTPPLASPGGPLKSPGVPPHVASPAAQGLMGSRGGGVPRPRCPAPRLPRSTTLPEADLLMELGGERHEIGPNPGSPGRASPAGSSSSSKNGAGAQALPRPRTAGAKSGPMLLSKFDEPGAGIAAVTSTGSSHRDEMYSILVADSTADPWQTGAVPADPAQRLHSRPSSQLALHLEEILSCLDSEDSDSTPQASLRSAPRGPAGRRQELLPRQQQAPPPPLSMEEILATLDEGDSDSTTTPTPTAGSLARIAFLSRVERPRLHLAATADLSTGASPGEAAGTDADEALGLQASRGAEERGGGATGGRRNSARSAIGQRPRTSAGEDSPKARRPGEAPGPPSVRATAGAVHRRHASADVFRRPRSMLQGSPLDSPALGPGNELRGSGPAAAAPVKASVAMWDPQGPADARIVQHTQGACGRGGELRRPQVPAAEGVGSGTLPAHRSPPRSDEWGASPPGAHLPRQASLGRSGQVSRPAASRPATDTETRHGTVVPQPESQVQSQPLSQSQIVPRQGSMGRRNVRPCPLDQEGESYATANSTGYKVGPSVRRGATQGSLEGETRTTVTLEDNESSQELLSRSHGRQAGATSHGSLPRSRSYGPLGLQRPAGVLSAHSGSGSGSSAPRSAAPGQVPHAEHREAERWDKDSGVPEASQKLRQEALPRSRSMMRPPSVDHQQQQFGRKGGLESDFPIRSLEGAAEVHSGPRSLPRGGLAHELGFLQGGSLNEREPPHFQKGPPRGVLRGPASGAPSQTAARSLPRSRSTVEGEWGRIQRSSPAGRQDLATSTGTNQDFCCQSFGMQRTASHPEEQQPGKVHLRPLTAVSELERGREQSMRDSLREQEAAGSAGVGVSITEPMQQRRLGDAAVNSAKSGSAANSQQGSSSAADLSNSGVSAISAKLRGRVSVRLAQAAAAARARVATMQASCGAVSQPLCKGSQEGEEPIRGPQEPERARFHVAGQQREARRAMLLCSKQSTAPSEREASGYTHGFRGCRTSSDPDSCLEVGNFGRNTSDLAPGRPERQGIGMGEASESLLDKLPTATEITSRRSLDENASERSTDWAFVEQLSYAPGQEGSGGSSCGSWKTYALIS